MILIILSLFQFAFPILEELPTKLSDLPSFEDSAQGWDVSDQTLPYELNVPLFSDYAKKLRTISIPNLVSSPIIQINPQGGEFEFPLGTILTKTFYYNPEDIQVLPPYPAVFPLPFKNALSPMDQKIPIETRILVHSSKGWIGASYLWDHQAQEAYLSELGENILLVYKGVEFTYTVPDKNQCLGCHIKTKNFERKILPLGPKLENMDTVSEQLKVMQDKGWFEKNAATPKATHPWRFHHLSLEEKAKSYLHINCAHCHNSQGPAKASGLFLTYDEKNKTKRGLCKAPVAVGNAGGNMPYVIYPGKPEKSLLIYRMKSTDPHTKMPELGRSLVDKENVELMENYIKEMKENCGKKIGN